MWCGQKDWPGIWPQAYAPSVVPLGVKLRLTPYALRLTPYALRLTPYALRLWARSNC